MINIKVTITLTKEEWEECVERHKDKLAYTYGDIKDITFGEYEVEETFLNSLSAEDMSTMLWEAEIEVK